MRPKREHGPKEQSRISARVIDSKALQIIIAISISTAIVLLLASSPLLDQARRRRDHIVVVVEERLFAARALRPCLPVILLCFDFSSSCRLQARVGSCWESNNVERAPSPVVPVLSSNSLPSLSPVLWPASYSLVPLSGAITRPRRR